MSSSRSLNITNAPLVNKTTITLPVLRKKHSIFSGEDPSSLITLFTLRLQSLKSTLLKL